MICNIIILRYIYIYINNYNTTKINLNNNFIWKYTLLDNDIINDIINKITRVKCLYYTFFTEKWDSKKCVIAPDLTG
jgi:hypothetical protein